MMMTTIAAAVICSALAPDPYEDDDTQQSARLITASVAERDHSIYPQSDWDWFTFTISEQKLLTVEVRVRSDEGVPVYATLFDSQDVTIDGTGHRFRRTIDAGTYFISVDSGFGGDTVARYEIFISIDDLVADRFEPNDTLFTATPVSLNARLSGLSLVPGGDADWFAFDIPDAMAGTPLVIEPESVRHQAFVTLFDAQNQQQGFTSEVLFVTLPAGPSRVRVDRDGNNEVLPNYTFTAWKQFGPDPFEQDDTPQTASTTALDGPNQWRNLLPAGDEDWVRFYAPAHESVEIGAGGSTNSSGFEPALELYDATGQDLLATGDSNLSYTPSADGVYLIRVRNQVTPGPQDNTVYFLAVHTPGATPDIFPGTLTGTVQDESAKPIEGASVVLRELSGFRRMSDSNGVYIFDALPQGSWTLDVSAPGYQAFSKSGIHVDSGLTAVNLALTATGAGPEDLNGDGTVNAVDVQTCINGALGVGPPADVNDDGTTNAVDVQLVINAALV